MRLVSGMREAYWSVIAEPILENDWDYKQWAADFFARCRSVTGGAEFKRWLVDHPRKRSIRSYLLYNLKDDEE